MGKASSTERELAPAASGDPANLHIGATIWFFDVNRRVYARDSATNKTVGGPIYREHFEPKIITGETATSWVVGTGNPNFGGGKIPKNPAKRDGGAHDGSDPTRHGAFYLTADAVDDAVWANSHRARLERALHGATAPQLRAVAEIIGYDPAKDGDGS